MFRHGADGVMQPALQFTLFHWIAGRSVTDASDQGTLRCRSSPGLIDALQRNWVDDAPESE